MSRPNHQTQRETRTRHTALTTMFGPRPVRVFASEVRE